MIDTQHLPMQGIASDSRSLDTLRTTSAKDPKAAVREAARQFEAVFMQELLKSMRSATMKSGMFDNEGGDMASEMLDSQYATQISGRPGGLGDLIARQLSRHMGDGAPVPAVALGNSTSSPEAAARPPRGERWSRLSEPAAARASAAASAPPVALSGRQGDFMREHWDAAQAATRETRIPAPFILAQAAHESGWGKRQIRMADGSASHNLFGIKAGAGWRGKVAEVTTTEYINGEPRKVTAKFRAYDSYAEAFGDYARLLTHNRRYADVLRQGNTAEGFAQGLQRAGYATDPAYADKLTRIINSALRLQRVHT